MTTEWKATAFFSGRNSDGEAWEGDMATVQHHDGLTTIEVLSTDRRGYLVVPTSLLTRGGRVGNHPPIPDVKPKKPKAEEDFDFG